MIRKTVYDCERQDKLIKLYKKERALAKELLQIGDLRERFWDSIKVKSKAFPSLFIEGHYEIIKNYAPQYSLQMDGRH